jgi:hypothetical protein
MCASRAVLQFFAPNEPGRVLGACGTFIANGLRRKPKPSLPQNIFQHSAATNRTIIYESFWGKRIVVITTNLATFENMSLSPDSLRARSSLRRPLVMRGSSDDEDLSLVDETAVDTSLSSGGRTLPKSIDWSVTDSSDEESQQQKLQRVRSFSEPHMDACMMRRRSRTLTADHPRHGAAAELEDEALQKTLRPRLSPILCLAALFAISCYTTFWLPYPGVSPVETDGIPKAMEAVVSLHRGAPRLGQALPAGWMAARSEVHNVAPLIYRKEEDPMLQFYQQDAFASHSYTKEANIAALFLVSVWAVWEHHRRRRQQPEDDTMSLDRVPV